MGRKLDRVTDKLRILTAESMQKSFGRGSEYDNGYAQGLFEAMQVVDDENTGRGKNWLIPKKKKQ
jgi:hypothetical protein